MLLQTCRFTCTDEIFGKYRVANAGAKTSRKKTSQHGGAASPYADWKVPQLRRRAKQVGIKGRSTMNKKQLVKALRAA